MMQIIEVFQVGSPVNIGKDVPAVITSVKISEHYHIQYEVAWFDGRARHCELLEQCEISRSAESASVKIGFK